MFGKHIYRSTNHREFELTDAAAMPIDTRAGDQSRPRPRAKKAKAAAVEAHAMRFIIGLCVIEMVIAVDRPKF